MAELGTIENEIKLILKTPQELPVKTYRGYVTLTKKNLHVQTLRVLSVDIKRDYATNYADEVIVTAVFPIGTYMNYIYANKEALEFVLITEPFTELNAFKPYKTKYKAILLNPEEVKVEGDISKYHDINSLDISNFYECKFQLLPKSIHHLRLAEVGGIYRETNMETVLKNLLPYELKKMKVDSSESIDSIEVYKPDNTDVQEQIVIPHGTPLYSVPDYLQDSNVGVYSNDICSYIQEKTWYIYPKFDLNRIPESQNQLTIIIIPKNKLQGIERTWRVKGKHFVILSTAGVSYENKGETKNLQHGTGTRFINANQILGDDSLSLSNNQAIQNRRTNAFETPVVNTIDGTTYAPLQKDENKITSNPYKQMSMLSGNDAGFFNITWQMSYPDAIKPGTTCKIIMLDEINSIYQFSGIVTGVQHNTKTISKGLILDNYITNSILAVWVKNELKDPLRFSNLLSGAEGLISGLGSNNLLNSFSSVVNTAKTTVSGLRGKLKSSQFLGGKW